jgi:hypothetical protein
MSRKEEKKKVYSMVTLIQNVYLEKGLIATFLGALKNLCHNISSYVS